MLTMYFFSSGHKDCGRKFSLFLCFAVHISRTHPDRRARQTWNRNVFLQLKCSINFCSTEYADIKGLVSHLSSHIQEGLTVTCPFDECSKTFNVKMSSHISRYHKSWNVTQILPVHIVKVAVQSSPGEEAHVSDSVPEEIDVTDADQSKDEAQDAYTENLPLFFLGLEAKHLVPPSTITEIVNEMKTLQDIQQEHTMDVLSRDLKQYSVSAEMLRCLGESAYEQSPVHKALHANGPSTTYYRRLQYYKTHYNYVQPVEVTLGYNDRGQKRHYHYIPILESLSVLLKEGRATLYDEDSSL